MPSRTVCPDALAVFKDSVLVTAQTGRLHVGLLRVVRKSPCFKVLDILYNNNTNKLHN